jgi:hypothetical protein
MPVEKYTRTGGKRLTYIIEYDYDKYFILRDGVMKKAVDALAEGVAPSELKQDLMLRLAIGDIEALNGMEE